jgi:uncharacterized integral membrane protein
MRFRQGYTPLFSVLVCAAQPAFAQGLPVKTGSPVPIAVMFLGAVLLGCVMAYGIVHTRKRSQADKMRTEQATRELYKDEERRRQV